MGTRHDHATCPLTNPCLQGISACRRRCFRTRSRCRLLVKRREGSEKEPLRFSVEARPARARHARFAGQSPPKSLVAVTHKFIEHRPRGLTAPKYSAPASRVRRAARLAQHTAPTLRTDRLHRATSKNSSLEKNINTDPVRRPMTLELFRSPPTLRNPTHDIPAGVP
jgi:hypothetical protein